MFIPKKSPIIGNHVRLLKSYTNDEGTFTTGHEFIVTMAMSNVYELQDLAGNILKNVNGSDISLLEFIDRDGENMLFS